MSGRVMIDVNDLGKQFRLRSAGTRTVKSAFLDALRGGRGTERFWALRHVTFSVCQGETLGLIGANGAGKSTLLSLLAGTKVPTEGTIHTEGTISSLLELGAGFHPDLTGRENVFLSGAIMGLSRRQMQERYDDIVAFSGIGKFIDQPVKHYSSGMYVRLGFAVAVEVDPDILLIDEVLAVGDAEFQRRCLEKIAEFREKGKTMLIISHDLGTIQSVSDRILLLDEGTVMGLGEPQGVLGQYRSMSRTKGKKGLEREWGTGEARIAEVTIEDAAGKPTDVFGWGDALTARLRYEATQTIENPVFGFALSDSSGRLVYGSNTQIEGVVIPHIEGNGGLTLCLGEMNLAPGTYLLSFSLHSADHRSNYHRLDHAFAIEIKHDKAFEGITLLPTTWSLDA